jgi:hypothetical protein
VADITGDSIVAAAASVAAQAMLRPSRGMLRCPVMVLCSIVSSLV